jgi:hypothetical protein
MSPEQAAGSPVIDPRTDVYALGATLYELLTQQAVVPGRERRECLRQILDEEPLPPRRLNRALPPELEVIILKALAKQPEERYGSARELADDLRRFLDDQPIRARRPTLRDWAAKWVRRHRRVVTAAVLLLAAAVLVLGATAYRVSRAESRALDALKKAEEEKDLAREALRREEVQRRRAEEALEREAVQRRRAEANSREARKVLAFLTRLGVEKLAGEAKFQELRRQLLGELLTYYQEFIDQHQDDPTAEAELVETRFQVAELLDELGRRAEARTTYLEAMRAFQGLPGSAEPPHCGPPRGVAPVMLLDQPAVQADLNLSPQQARKVATLLDFRGKPLTDDKLDAVEKGLADVLKPEQAVRLRQLVLQARGPQALLDPDTAQALGLSDRQKEEIRSLLVRSEGGPGRPEGPGGPGRPKGDGPGRRDGPGRQNGPGGPGGRGPGGPGDRGPGDRGPGGPGGWREGPGGPKDGGHSPEADRSQLNEQVLRVLTAEQRVRWQKMLGEPFRGELRVEPPSRPDFPPPHP